jgi:hypothetical protein
MHDFTANTAVQQLRHLLVGSGALAQHMCMLSGRVGRWALTVTAVPFSGNFFFGSTSDRTDFDLFI